MPRKILLLFTITALLAVVYVAHAQHQAVLDDEATLASVAQANGVRGGDLAEALGMPRAVAKDKPLKELGVDETSLREALASLGVSATDQVLTRTSSAVDSEMSISRVIDHMRRLNPEMSVTGQALARELGLDANVVKDRPLIESGISTEQLQSAVDHLLEHEETGWQNLKYPLYILIVLFAAAWLLKLGIPHGADPGRRKGYYPQWVFVVVLLLSVLVLGFALGKSPNPMESVVKVFKATVGLYESVWAKLGLLGFFLALAVVANKAVCGWACPFGALQELLYMLPLFRRIKRRKLPLWASNSVRLAFFVIFLFLLYGVIGKTGYVVYHNMNPFNLFNLEFTGLLMACLTFGYLVAALFLYRPFCRFVCPFGVISWFFERLSLSKIRIDRERCTDCRACVAACPLTAAGDRLAGHALPADCFSCMRCLRVCPADAIHFRQAWGGPSPPERVREQEPGPGTAAD